MEITKLGAEISFVLSSYKNGPYYSEYADVRELHTRKIVLRATDVTSEHMRGMRDPKSAAPFEDLLDAKRKALDVSSISMQWCRAVKPVEHCNVAECKAFIESRQGQPSDLGINELRAVVRSCLAMEAFCGGPRV